MDVGVEGLDTGLAKGLGSVNPVSGCMGNVQSIQPIKSSWTSGPFGVSTSMTANTRFFDLLLNTGPEPDIGPDKDVDKWANHGVCKATSPGRNNGVNGADGFSDIDDIDDIDIDDARGSGLYCILSLPSPYPPSSANTSSGSGLPKSHPKRWMGGGYRNVVVMCAKKQK